MDFSSLFVPDFEFEDLDVLLLELQQHDKEIVVGVMSTGEAAAHALVWEFGNVRQTKPGPKTVIGTNPDGKMVWLSAQAPLGYIRIHTPEFWSIVEDEMSRLDLNQPSARDMTRELEKGASRMAKKMAEVIKHGSRFGPGAPVDSGDLLSSITPVAPGDPILDKDDDLEIEEE